MRKEIGTFYFKIYRSYLFLSSSYQPFHLGCEEIRMSLSVFVSLPLKIQSLKKKFFLPQQLPCILPIQHLLVVCGCLASHTLLSLP